MEIGASVGLAGYVLLGHLPLIQRVGGVFLIVMGLRISGVIQRSRTSSWWTARE